MLICQRMDSSYTDSSSWAKMSQFIASVASENISLEDFNSQLLIKEQRMGEGYHDYNRTLDRLISDGIILVDDKRLHLGKIVNVDWIENGLKHGEAYIWELAELIDPKSTLIKKYDDTRLKEIGDIGEEAVIELLRLKLDESYHEKISHVAAINDTAGYDILAPSISNNEKQVLLEVKTTVRPSTDFTFYLSRNEYRVALRSRGWNIICVKIISNIPKILGYIELQHFEDWLPREIDHRAKWATLKITIDVGDLKPGLP